MLTTHAAVRVERSVWVSRRLMAYNGRCDHYPDIGHCYPETFQAAYVGYPFTHEFKRTGGHRSPINLFALITVTFRDSLDHTGNNREMAKGSYTS